MMSCRSCAEARAKLLAGYPGQAAALAARTLWWKARRGRLTKEEERRRFMDELNVAKSLPPFGSQPGDANGRS